MPKQFFRARPKRAHRGDPSTSFGHFYIFAFTTGGGTSTSPASNTTVISWGKAFGARLDYVAEFLPVVILRQPTKTDVWGDPFSLSHKTVPGLGISPIGLRIIWRDGKRWKPYYTIKGGLIGFTQKAISNYASYEDFSLQQSVGIQFRLTDRYDFRAGVSDFHFPSNGFIVPNNPGIDEMSWSGGLSVHFGTRALHLLTQARKPAGRSETPPSPRGPGILRPTRERASPSDTPEKLAERSLQQLDRDHLQRLALHAARHIHAQMIGLPRGLQFLHDLRVPRRIELQKLLILGHDAKAAACALQRTVACVCIGIRSHFARAIHVDHGHIVIGCAKRERRDVSARPASTSNEVILLIWFLRLKCFGCSPRSCRSETRCRWLRNLHALPRSVHCTKLR